MFVASSVIGPVLGGVFAEKLHWSMIFWINLPLGLVALRLTDRALRALPRHERPHRLDLIGAALIVAATICFLLALSWGGARYSWGSPPLLACSAPRRCCRCLFAVRLATAAEPFLPLSVLREPVVRAAAPPRPASRWAPSSACRSTCRSYFELARGLTAAQSGFALIPLMSGVILGATTAARLMARIRHYSRPPLAGLVLAMLGCLALAARPVVAAADRGRSCSWRWSASGWHRAAR